MNPILTTLRVAAGRRPAVTNRVAAAATTKGLATLRRVAWREILNQTAQVQLTSEPVRAILRSVRVSFLNGLNTNGIQILFLINTGRLKASCRTLRLLSSTPFLCLFLCWNGAWIDGFSWLLFSFSTVILCPASNIAGRTTSTAGRSRRHRSPVDPNDNTCQPGQTESSEGRCYQTL